jgi:oligoendopeptidase F
MNNKIEDFQKYTNWRGDYKKSRFIYLIFPLLLFLLLFNNNIRMKLKSFFNEKIIMFYKNNSDISMVAKDNIEIAPEWDLSIFYQAIDDPEISSNLIKIESDVDNFVKQYSSVNFKKIKAKKLYTILAEKEQIDLQLSRLSLFSYLSFAKDSANEDISRFYSNINRTSTMLASKMNFLKHKLFEIKNIDSLVKDKDLIFYKPYLYEILKYKTHKMNPEVERFAIENSIAGSSAVIKFYDKTLSSIAIDYKGKKLNIASAAAYLNGKDRKTREEVSILLNKALTERSDIFLFAFNTLLKDKQIFDKWKNYPEPISAELLDNNVKKETIDALVDTVSKNYNKTSHRYYKIKAKILNLDKLEYYDRNAPLPFASNKSYTFEEAKKIVLDSYSKFSPKLAAAAEEIFNKNRIDAKILPNKASGAFCTHIEPFILMNYSGRLEDVLTLAHEMGHAVQSKESFAKYGILMSSAPLILAEIPSTFAENLVLQELISTAKDKNERLSIMSLTIERALNTIARQIAFHKFEVKAHFLSREGELSKEDLENLWIEISKEQLGDYVNVDNSCSSYWYHISHFFHHPFYVHSYAFSDLASYALLNAPKEKDFGDKYITFMTDITVKNYDELLSSFGFDPDKKEFWENGIDYISTLIDNFEKELSQS